MIKWGWVKDKEDSRDYPATRLIVKPVVLPKEYIVNPNTIIYDQNGLPACVGFATAGVKTDEEWLQWKKQISFDGEWLYNECKKQDGVPDVEGTFPRVALKIIKSLGMKRVGLCKKPEKKWIINSYYRITSNNNDDFIKQVLYQFGSILIGSSWYENWMNVADLFPIPNKKVGGHAYRIYGWNNIGFIVVNSWGKALWGINGIATMPYDIFRGEILSEGDCWKLVDNTTMKRIL